MIKGEREADSKSPTGSIPRDGLGKLRNKSQNCVLNSPAIKSRFDDIGTVVCP